MSAPDPRGGQRDRARGVLRVMTCGSVDAGKSTLLGRLLHDASGLRADELARVGAGPGREGPGREGEAVDFSRLLDGLEDERLQGITIDVAHRYLATSARALVLADAPGHEAYTRNMASAASRADVAVLVIDAGEGATTQTRRHAAICALMRTPHLIIVANKLDLVADPAVALAAAAQFARELAEGQGVAQVSGAAGGGFASVQAVGVIATSGANVVERAPALDLDGAGSLLDRLHALPVGAAGAGLRVEGAPVRLLVQRVERTPEGRLYAGRVLSGSVEAGGASVIARTGESATIAELLHPDGARTRAHAGEAVMARLLEDRDLTRGDVLCAPGAVCVFADQVQAQVLWTDAEPLAPGRSYEVRIGAQTVVGRVSALAHRVDPDTGLTRPATTLGVNDIGLCTLAFSAPVAFDPYAENRDMGGLLIVSRESGRTVGAGMITFALRRTDTLRWAAHSVTQTDRAELMGQAARVVWFTGLSGAGKSAIADLVERRLHARGRHTYLLDGDNVRHGLNRDLGFTLADRVENIRRIGEVAKLMTDAGLIVLCAFISPYRAERRAVRDLFPSGQFFEVHVEASLAACEARDPKGLYARARAGQLPNFTGVDSPYEPPEAPELRLDTERLSPEEAADAVIALIEGRP